SNPERRTAYDRQLLESMMAGGQGLAAPPFYPQGNGQTSSPAAPRTARPPAYRTYDKIKHEAELRGKTLEDFLKLKPKFTEGTRAVEPQPARPRPHFSSHFLAEKSPAPEPVESENLIPVEEITSAEQGLSMAASLAIDAKVEQALEILQRLESAYANDPLYPKVIWRLGELYFKSLGAPERALGYFRRLMDSYPGSVESLMAEKRVETIESFSPKPTMDLASARIVDDLGELWIAECPHCKNPVRVPARSGVWFICPQCHERSTVTSPEGGTS
ncbi:MAG: tetratricopeptide repeat protein, partial [bacterium]